MCNVPAWAARQRLAVWAGLGVLIATVLALALRLYQLDGRSLWLDEILASQTAHLAGPAQVVTWSKAAINQMPFFYMFIWFFGHWGDTAFVLRLPAVLAGTLLVPAVFLTGRSLLGVRAGFVAALLTAVLPFAVWYSQEARPYSLLMLMTTLQMYFAFWSVKRSRVTDWLGLAGFTVLNLYTHYVALTVTVTVAVFVFIFVVDDALARASAWAKAGVGFLLAVTAAVAVLGLRAAYEFAKPYAKGHLTLALGLAGVAIVLVALFALLLRRRSPIVRRLATEPRFRKLRLAATTGVLVSLAYLPWLPSLLVLLGRPDQSLGQIHLDHPAALSDLAYTLAGLDLTGFMLVALCIGIIAASVWGFAGQTMEWVLLLTWVGVPLVILIATAGPNAVAVDPRYVAFLVPAAMIVIAAGVETIALLLQRLVTAGAHTGAAHLRGRVGTMSAIAALLILLAQTLPTLASSYAEPKNDYRALAQHIAAASPHGSVVISLGNYADWTVICLGYYFRQMHDLDSMAVDGLQVDRSLVDLLNSGTRAVWGVVIFPSAEQQSLLNAPGPPTVDFIDVTHQIFLVKPSGGLTSPTAQASELLRWELPLEPALAASLARIAGPSTS